MGRDTVGMIYKPHISVLREAEEDSRFLLLEPKPCPDISRSECIPEVFLGFWQRIVINCRYGLPREVEWRNEIRNDMSSRHPPGTSLSGLKN